jgi:hypothetical protein
VIEWIPGYNGGHEQTFNIQYRIVNESKRWIPQQIPQYNKKIPQYNKQTYTLLGLQRTTWYELPVIHSITILVSVELTKVKFVGVRGAPTT